MSAKRPAVAGGGNSVSGQEDQDAGFSAKRHRSEVDDQDNMQGFYDRMDEVWRDDFEHTTASHLKSRSRVPLPFELVVVLFRVSATRWCVYAYKCCDKMMKQCVDRSVI